MFVQVAVQGDAVALVEQVLQGVDALDAQRALQAVLQIGVVEDDVEAENLGSHCNRLARTTWGHKQRVYKVCQRAQRHRGISRTLTERVFSRKSQASSKVALLNTSSLIIYMSC